MYRLAHETLYDALCGALRKPLSEGGWLGLVAALKDRDAGEIAAAMRSLTYPEALVVFNWIDNARASQVLPLLDATEEEYLLTNAPSGRLAGLAMQPH